MFHASRIYQGEVVVVAEVYLLLYLSLGGFYIICSEEREGGGSRSLAVIAGDL